MFKAGDKYVQIDTPFEHNGMRYPSNWIRLASPEERAAIGLVEISDRVDFDRRFFMPLSSHDSSDGNPIPRELRLVQETQIAALNETIHRLLQPTDWMYIRRLDTGEAIPNSVVDFRARIREYGAEIKERVKAANSVEEVKDIVTTQSWPQL